MNPKNPIFIISKGRADTRLTSKVLEKIKVPYHIVIESQEYNDYAAVIDPKKILVLPFSNLGQGSIPARNWVWNYSIENGNEKHWLLDDNISTFYRLNKNMRVQVADGAIFKSAEDFVDRYENIALAGFQYRAFSVSSTKWPAFTLNTRVYSCTLIKNDLPHRWRGKYNEDTDLSLRILKDGYCTILFNAFLCGKAPTLIDKGGNTDNVYVDGDERYKFAESLQKQHPDVVKIVRRYGRWHHQVDYRPFKKNRLIKKEGLKIAEGVNDYGMKLVKKDNKIKKVKNE